MNEFKGLAQRQKEEILKDLKERGAESEHHESLLGFLHETNEEMSNPLTNTELLGNTTSFAIGGNDSTSSGLLHFSALQTRETSRVASSTQDTT